MTKKYLADINVWLALAIDSHSQHRPAKKWFNSLAEESVVFCRMTQQGFFRLISDKRIFGDDALTLRDSWNAFDQFNSDFRVGTFAHEPPSIEMAWRKYTGRNSFSPKFWNDAYLAAFVKQANFRIATFDKAFSQFTEIESVILGAGS
jgi:toxin-antitoxin system PIN domain toxin